METLEFWVRFLVARGCDECEAENVADYFLTQKLGNYALNGANGLDVWAYCLQVWKSYKGGAK